MFGTTLLGPGHVLTFVTASVAAGVIIKNSFAVHQEGGPGDKTESLG